MDRHTHEQKFGEFDLNFIELPKFDKKEEELVTPIDKWTFFIKNADELEVMPDNIDDEGLKEYDYLLNMPLSSLTKEKVSALKKEAVLKDSEFHKMQATTASDLWRHDLDKLEVQLQKLIKS